MTICAYCHHTIGQPFEYRGTIMLLYAHGDHFIPRIAGGSDAPANRVTSCVVCNTFKAAKIFQSIEAASVACRAFWDSPDFDSAAVQRAIERKWAGYQRGGLNQSREDKSRAGRRGIQKMTPEIRSQAGRASFGADRDRASICGRANGRALQARRRALRLTAFGETKEVAGARLRAMPREVKSAGGRAAQATRSPQERTAIAERANHIRWHARQGIARPGCSLCRP